MTLVQEFRKHKHLERKYKYFQTLWYESKPKTAVFMLVTNSRYDVLGFVKWYAPWRQYCFFPDKDMVYSRGCMREINEFIDLLMDDRKNGGV